LPDALLSLRDQYTSWPEDESCSQSAAADVDADGQIPHELFELLHELTTVTSAQLSRTSTKRSCPHQGSNDVTRIDNDCSAMQASMAALIHGIQE
jgi:hypothetical protein